MRYMAASGDISWRISGIMPLVSLLTQLLMALQAAPSKGS